MEPESPDHALSSVHEFFQAWVTFHGSEGAVGEVAQWLATCDSDPGALKEIVGRHGAAHEIWFRAGMLDLVLGYVTHRLAIGEIDLAAVAAIGSLRRLLHVTGRELLDHRPRELSQLLTQQMDLVLADGQLSEEEDLYLVELQSAFDLSYDEYLGLARPALQQPFGPTGINSGGRPSESWNAVDTLREIAERQRRSLGHLY